jgi:glycosyltransferase involved in cell wall biosynthesis
MKITYITNSRIPSERANSIQIIEMCKAFSKTGVELELILPKRFNSKRENIYGQYGLEKGLFTISYIPCIDTQPLIRSWQPFIIKSFFSWFQWFTFGLSSLFVKSSDFIFTRDELTLFFQSLKGKKVVLEIHTLPQRGKAFYKKLISRAYGIVVITEHLKKLLVEEYEIPEEKVFVAHDAIDLEKFKKKVDRKKKREELKIPQNKEIIMYIGALEGWKGHDTLLEASHLFPKNAELVIIGGSDEKVARLRKKYPKVQFLGFRHYEELSGNQQTADILVIPNSGKSLISKYYTSPLKLFAHMASKRPLLCSNLPSMREVVSEQEVYFFEADNPKDLAQQVKLILKDEKEAKNKAYNASQKVKHYTWKKRAKSIREFIEEKNKNAG